MGDLIVLKLGGSVLTFKDKPFEANFKNLERLANEISRAYRSRKMKLVIVHGAGSFGHPLVLESKIHEGIRDKNQLISFAKVQSWQNYWNHLVTTILQEKGLPAIPCQPSSLAIVEKGRITWMPLDAIKGMVKIGLIPVLYGVPAYDRTQGCSILSGDEIVVYLARKLRAKRAIYGTDVDGIYTSDPKRDAGARLIERVDMGNLEEIKSFLSASSSPDVTGGMLWKFIRLVKAAKEGVEFLIVNASKPGIVEKALKGEPVKGTLIKLKERDPAGKPI